MDKIDRIATRLLEDWLAKAPYHPLTGELRPADLDEAYAAQRAFQQLLIEHRGPIMGRKIALSSRAMQEMVGLDAPVGGAFFQRDLRQTPAEVSLSNFQRLGLEYELAFEVGADVRPGGHTYSAADALDTVAAVRPAFELIDDRNADYSDLCAVTLTADNAWCGGVVLGSPIEDWQSLDLADLTAALHQDGHEPEPANTGAADPLASLAWVLNHVTSGGETIAQGEHIITGSVLRTRFPEGGDRFNYEITGHAAVSVAIT